MKHFALAIFKIFILLPCFAQQYAEVAFEVKRKQDVKVCTYLYSQQQAPNSTKGGAPYNYMCIQKVGDTLYHYTIRDISDTVGLIQNGLAARIDVNSKFFDYRYATIYNMVNDTLWEKRIYKTGYTTNTQFCNNNVLSTGDKETYIQEWNPYAEQPLPRQAHMLDTNVRIGVNGKVYNCIKVLVSYGMPHDAGVRVTKFSPWVYDRTYFYLRKSDFLPVKIETATTVSQLEPKADYELSAAPFKLFKAME